MSYFVITKIDFALDRLHQLLKDVERRGKNKGINPALDRVQENQSIQGLIKKHIDKLNDLKTELRTEQSN